MKIEIKNRFSGNIIFSIETESWRLAVEAAIKAKANLSAADLSAADLSDADLSSADLSDADLSAADLRYANLSSANLRAADLRFADLSSANLSFADLSSADLSDADLSAADLRYANLSSANLRAADLRFADLSSANLRFADLRYANLHGYYCFGPGGSRNDYTWARWEAGKYMVHCGCCKLPLDEFKHKVIETHGDSYNAQWYLTNIQTMEFIAKESEAAYRRSIKE